MKKEFVLVILFLLVGVNFASAMPVGISKNDRQIVEDLPSTGERICETPDEPEENEEETPDPSFGGSSPPQPLAGHVSVDAMGPYGTPTAPYYEGDTVNFGAQIINGSNSDYLFRWDVEDDGIWEKDFPGSVKGDAYYSHEFKDDQIGKARVDAWDGVSMKWVSGSGNLWNQKYPGSGYIGGYYYSTVGMKFEVNRTITLSEVGVCRNYYPHEYFNIRLWDASQNLLSQVSNPNVTKGTWNWFLISPVTIPAGEYVLSVGIRGYFQHSDNNPGPSSDGMINPLAWVRSSSQYSYPNQDMGSSPIPLLDMNYTYQYQAPDVLTNTANVHVENVAPSVDAGSDIIGRVSDPIFFNGNFTDPGTDDTHTIKWDLGDGNITSVNLTPVHIFTLPGTYIVNLTVTDDDGGVGYDILVVTVRSNSTVVTQILDLEGSVENLSLPPGLENSYRVKLINALKMYESGHYKTAIKILEAFINHIKAQRGKKIPEMEADALIDHTLDLIEKIEDEMQH